MSMKHSRGYTLIESLLVLGIIGILYAISIPMYMDIIERLVG